MEAGNTAALYVTVGRVSCKPMVEHSARQVPGTPTGASVKPDVSPNEVGGEEESSTSSEGRLRDITTVHIQHCGVKGQPAWVDVRRIQWWIAGRIRIGG